jgi:lipopolysaccharide export system permease protein
MGVLDRYLTRSFVGGYFLLLAVFIGMYILLELMFNLDEFTEDSSRGPLQVLGLIVDYYKYKVPLYYGQLGGAVLAMAGGFTVAAMLRNNEMVALVAAGVPLQRLAAPLIVSSVVLIGLWMANQEFVVPRFAEKIARTHDDVTGVRTSGVYAARDERNAILSAQRLDPISGRLHRVFIIEPDPTGAPAGVIQADSAAWDPAAQVWRLTRGVRIWQGPQQADGLGAAILKTPVDEFAYSLTPEQLVLRRDSQWESLLSLRQLHALRNVPNLANRATVEANLHLRLTQPLVQLILLLLTLPFFLTRLPPNVITAGGKALLLGGIFFLVVSLSQSLVRDESAAAMVAWAPIFLFGPISVVLLASAKT